MKTARFLIPVLGLALLGACASAPTHTADNSAVAANIRAHRQASVMLPVSTIRMTNAIDRYNKNKTEPPVSMHTTNSVSDE